MARLGSWIEPFPEGIYVRPADAWVDPSQPKARALITHGHADHARGGHGEVWATPETLAIMATRYGEQSGRPTAYGESCRLGDVEVSFLPAGHVLGSAQILLDYRDVDVVAEVRRLTGGGADVAIEALGTQQTFESALRSLRPAGTLSSLGVYSGKLEIPYSAFAAGIGDHRIVTTLCPGGKERMRRLMEVVRHGRVDLTPLLTHTFVLDDIAAAYDLFAERLDGVMKVAIRP